MASQFDKEFQNTIYHDPQRYDAEHWWKEDDIPLWRTLFKRAPGPKVLELAAGTGRLALPRLESGAQ